MTGFVYYFDTGCNFIIMCKNTVLGQEFTYWHVKKYYYVYN